MTALEQKLLDELEQLERERERERQELESLAKSYKQSIEQVSNSLTAEYQQKLTELIQSENKEQSSLIAYLQTISQQNQQIIKLLKKPAEPNETIEQLKPLLVDLFEDLAMTLKHSNEQFVEGIMISLEELYKQ